jgi:hypothetical protein
VWGKETVSMVKKSTLSIVLETSICSTRLSFALKRKRFVEVADNLSGRAAHDHERRNDRIVGQTEKKLSEEDWLPLRRTLFHPQFRSNLSKCIARQSFLHKVSE